MGEPVVLGMDPHKRSVTVEAIDIYFGGPGDRVDDITITPLGERYFGVTTDLPASSKDTPSRGASGLTRR